MKHYILSSGISSAKIARYMNDYVVVCTRFEFKEEEFTTLCRDSFDGLDKWVEDNFPLIHAT